MEKLTYETAGKQISLYPGNDPHSPLIVLNASEEEGPNTERLLQKMQAPDHTLLVVENLDWQKDMSPWDFPAVFKGGEPFTAGADTFLSLLTDQIIPQAEERAGLTPPWCAVTGYSLAGLFALYALYKTALFTRAASISGSLWLPPFPGFIQTHDMAVRPDRIYLSLGDREDCTRSQYMRNVKIHTDIAADLYRSKGIGVTWELNPGNHFKEPDVRTAKGILKLLS